MIKNIKNKNIKRTKGDYLLLKQKINHLGSTFCAKLIIKLTSKIFIPDLYLQILKYEYNNRTNDDIAKTLPRFQSLENLNEYIRYKEEKNNNNSSKMILDLAWVSFYKYNKKLTFVKKANEDLHKFFLVLNGNLSQLNLTFKKEKISIEEYLIYMIKMKLLHEKQILYKCNKLNNQYVNLDINNFRTFFAQNRNYDFKELKNRAKQELSEAGFIFKSNHKVLIPSLDEYLKLGFFQTVERNDTETRFFLYIGNYVKINTLSKGDYIGDLSPNDNYEGSSYLCDKNCDICYVNKITSAKSKLYYYMLQKYVRIFKEIKHKFYIFKDTNDDLCINNYVPLMIYKQYKKGEKIIIQNAQYEGIYLIIEGDVKISISQTFNELSNTLVSLQYSIFNFKDYVSKIIKTIDIIKEFNVKYMLKKNSYNDKQMTDINGEKKVDADILSSNEYLSYFKGIKNIDFYNLSEGDIVGLNELFDYKTELYNFNAECVSDEAHLLFLSKKHFSIIMEKENNIMNNAIQLIDLKAKTLIGKINNFRYDYRKIVINTLNSKKIKNKNIKDKILAVFNEKKDEKKNEKKETSKEKKKETSKEGKKETTKEQNTNMNMNRRTKSKESIINGRMRDIIIGINKRRICFKNNEAQKSVKLFKNNQLLNYLQNRDLVRNNSITDSLNLNNINKKLLSHRYIYKSNYNKIFAANNPIGFNFSKKIRLSSNLLIAQYNPMLSRNDIDEKNIQTKGNDISSNNNTQNNTINKIMYNYNSITPTAETLLIDIMNNQKKFDEFQRAKYSGDNNEKNNDNDNEKNNENKTTIDNRYLPKIKTKIKIKTKNHREELVIKKRGKTISFKKLLRKKIKDSEN